MAALEQVFGVLVCAGLAQAPDAFQLSVNVDLVVLQVVASDHGGRLPPDLSQSDFEIYEDGVRQTIRVFRHEDAPVTVGLVIDHSGSMRSKLAEVEAAAHAFAQASNPRDQMFVVNFNDRVDVPLTNGSPFVSLPADLERAIRLDRAAGMTKLYDAVFQAQEQLQACGMEKKALIVISDGGDNASGHKLAEVLKNAESSPALIYTIGLFDEDDADRNRDVLRRLARFTGGEAYFPPQLDGTVAVCQRIARDIRNQYTLGYVSTNQTRTGAFRHIRVAVSAPGRGKLNVRTRSGYIAGVK